MTYSLHQLDAFEFEVRRAAGYYAVEAPEMLDAFLIELDATVTRVARYPMAPRIIRGSTRAMHMRAHFPYSVLYVVHEHLDLVDLTIFLHDRQDEQGLIPRFG